MGAGRRKLTQNLALTADYTYRNRDLQKGSTPAWVQIQLLMVLPAGSPHDRSWVFVWGLIRPPPLAVSVRNSYTASRL